MNKVLTAIIITIATFSFASCGGKSTTVSGQTVPAGGAVQSQNGDGYILRNDTGFYEINLGTAKYKAGLILGERVTFLGETVKATYEGNEYDFAKIKTEEGKEGFVLAYYLAVNGELAVVTGNTATVYKTPKLADPTTIILPRSTVIVVFPTLAKDSFIGFSAFNPSPKDKEQSNFKEQYIKSSEISKTATDVQSAILLQIALKSKDIGKRKTLLESALSEYPGSAFDEEIQIARSGGQKRESQPLNAEMTANDDNINVRALPDEKFGEIKGTLTKGTSVIVIEETKEEYEVEGKKAKWYRISSPDQGWVFGAFLDK